MNGLLTVLTSLLLRDRGLSSASGLGWSAPFRRRASPASQSLSLSKVSARSSPVPVLLADEASAAGAEFSSSLALCPPRAASPASSTYSAQPAGGQARLARHLHPLRQPRRSASPASGSLRAFSLGGPALQPAHPLARSHLALQAEPGGAGMEKRPASSVETFLGGPLARHNPDPRWSSR